MLLEKAWAKLHGTYLKTESGMPHFAAAHLLGTPTSVFEHEIRRKATESMKDEDFNVLRKWDRQNFLMFASSIGSGEVRGHDGIVKGHAYALLNVYEVAD